MSENPIIIEHEEIPNQEPTKETRKTKAINFYKKHKKAIVTGASVVGGIVTVSVLKSLTSDKDTEAEYEDTENQGDEYFEPIFDFNEEEMIDAMNRELDRQKAESSVEEETNPTDEPQQEIEE